jgi:hypothetical protein
MVMNMKYFVVLALVMLAGCAASPPGKFIGPGGRDAYIFSSCSGKRMATCFNGAAAVCPSGYSIVSQSSTPFMVTNPHTKSSVMVTAERLVVECK